MNGGGSAGWRAPANLEFAAAPRSIRDINIPLLSGWTISRSLAVLEGNTRLPPHVSAVESRRINPIYGRPVRRLPPHGKAALFSFE